MLEPIYINSPTDRKHRVNAMAMHVVNSIIISNPDYSESDIVDSAFLLAERFIDKCDEADVQ